MRASAGPSPSSLPQARRGSGRAAGTARGLARRTPGPVGCPGRRGRAGVPGAGGGVGRRASGRAGGGGVPRGRWPAPAPSASRPAPPRRPGGGGGHSSHSSPRPSPRLHRTRGGRKSRPPAGARWPAPASRRGVTGCGRCRGLVTSLPPSGLWAGETLALGVGMQEGRKCGGRDGAGPAPPLLARPPARLLGQLRPAGLQQLPGPELERRRRGPSLAGGWGGEPRAGGNRIPGERHRKRVRPFGREAANSGDPGPLGRPARKLAGAPSGRQRGNLSVLGRQCPPGIRLVSRGARVCCEHGVRKAPLRKGQGKEGT